MALRGDDFLDGGCLQRQPMHCPVPSASSAVSDAERMFRRMHLLQVPAPAEQESEVALDNPAFVPTWAAVLTTV